MHCVYTDKMCKDSRRLPNEEEIGTEGYKLGKVTFLFWNLNRKALLELLKSMAREHRVDVVVLAENRIPVAELLEGLNTGERAKFCAPPNPSSYLTYLTL